MPQARSTTMPPKSTKPKEASPFYEKLELARDSKGNQLLVRPKVPSTTIPPSFTKHKDAHRLPEEDARDPKPERFVPLRPKACSTTMPPESKVKGDPMESLSPTLEYTTMQSKGYDKSNGCATHRSRADTTTEGSETEGNETEGSETEGSDVEEAADEGGVAAGGEPDAKEAAGTAEVLLKRVLMMQVLLERRLLIMEALLERRLLVMGALLEESLLATRRMEERLQEGWLLRRGSVRKSHGGEEAEGDEETLVGDA